jgi:uncharacterized protein YkwD
MAEERVPFSHDNFDKRVQRFPFSRLLAAGENVALNRGFMEVAQVAVNGWIESEGHRLNLIGRFTWCGIGVVRGGSGWFLTQLFARA